MRSEHISRPDPSKDFPPPPPLDPHKANPPAFGVQAFHGLPAATYPTMRSQVFWGSTNPEQTQLLTCGFAFRSTCHRCKLFSQPLQLRTLMYKVGDEPSPFAAPTRQARQDLRPELDGLFIHRFVQKPAAYGRVVTACAGSVECLKPLYGFEREYVLRSFRVVFR